MQTTEDKFVVIENELIQSAYNEAEDFYDFEDLLTEEGVFIEPPRVFNIWSDLNKLYK